MKRPRQHELDTMGAAQLRAAFAKLGWTVEEIQSDYGIDFDVEVFQNGKTTGIIFRVQLKSSESTAYSEDGSYISERIGLSNARYLSAESHTPTLLVHADVRNQKVFWTAPQLDSVITSRLDANPEKETITFRIPTANLLPDTSLQLLRAVAQAEMLLSTRTLMSAPVPDFLASIEDRVDKDRVGQELKNKSDAIRMSQAEELFKAGSYAEVREKTRRIISDRDASVENRVWAVLTAERLEIIEAIRNGAAPQDIARIQLTIRAELKNVTRKGPKHLRFFALIAFAAAKLHLLTANDAAMFMNWRMNEGNRDAFWRAQLAYKRARLREQVVRVYAQCMRWVDYAMNSNSFVALPRALLYIVEAVGPFVVSLQNEGHSDAAAVYTSGAFDLCQLAASIALVMEDDEVLGWAAGHAVAVVQNPSSPIYAWALEMISKIKEKELHDYFSGQLERLTVNDEVSLTLAEEQRAYRSMAASLGINLADSSDEISRIVQIGITDLDPTSVLKNCQHLFVSLGSSGLVAEMLQLPTAGSKVLHCTLKDTSIEGISLDSVYDTFKAKLCDGCAECRPHPAGWKYSHAWQREQNERHKKFLERGRR